MKSCSLPENFFELELFLCCIMKFSILSRWCFGINSSSQKMIRVIRRHENLLNLKFVLIFVFLWCTEIESGLLLIFVVLTIVKIPIVVFQFSSTFFLKFFYCEFSRHCVAFVSRSFVLVDAFGDVLVALRSYPLIFHFGSWLFMNIPVWW